MLSDVVEVNLTKMNDDKDDQELEIYEIQYYGCGKFVSIIQSDIIPFRSD